GDPWQVFSQQDFRFCLVRTPAIAALSMIGRIASIRVEAARRQRGARRPSSRRDDAGIAAVKKKARHQAGPLLPRPAAISGRGSSPAGSS
ncbi:hypothetical protein, partial [Clostridium perfringens]